MSLPSNPVKRGLYSFTTGLFASISSIILGMYEATLNIEIQGEEHLLMASALDNRYILTVWHSFVDAAAFVFHSKNILIYSDHPRTLRYEKSMAHFFREVGIKTLHNRGFQVLDASLGKQSSAIIHFIKKIKDGNAALIAPDGPHGPIYKAKPGSVFIGGKTGSPIIPLGFAFSRKIQGPNWDDFSLPLPFSKIIVMVGEPLDAPQDSTKLKEFSLILENRLDMLCFKANNILNGDEP
ncbi:MAG: hypothetical protein OEV66_03525 [Spirochaetia bacterium]|nr:hypothetical protein [Spirochaetia bacterium]